jgi:hypothetical protein
VLNQCATDFGLGQLTGLGSDGLGWVGLLALVMY